MDELNCPRCAQPMSEVVLSELRLWQCVDRHGVYLDRTQLGSLIEAEHDWHINDGQHTTPMPRITANMAPPPAQTPRARAWVETLFA